MTDSHKLALAAHLHVLLRRRTGRVTDTEWMVANADYAREVVRFARAYAAEKGDAEIAEHARKLEAMVLPPPPPTPAPGGERPVGTRYIGRLR